MTFLGHGVCSIAISEHAIAIKSLSAHPMPLMLAYFKTSVLKQTMLGSTPQRTCSLIYLYK